MEWFIKRGKKKIEDKREKDKKDDLFKLNYSNIEKSNANLLNNDDLFSNISEEKENKKESSFMKAFQNQNKKNRKDLNFKNFLTIKPLIDTILFH